MTYEYYVWTGIDYPSVEYCDQVDAHPDLNNVFDDVEFVISPFSVNTSIWATTKFADQGYHRVRRSHPSAENDVDTSMVVPSKPVDEERNPVVFGDGTGAAICVNQ